MPRSGNSRPYECVRRAWHSDRHQSMRGSIVQEIFRVANEIHKPATKRNKEWQEKLPVVVLKAEEILFSKADSEAEYTELETLLDRINDAVNTIIRRDESTETAQLLQPCIEAALHLGCTPRRASRSQRNDDPRWYLSPCAQKAENFSTRTMNLTTQPNPANDSLRIPNYAKFVNKNSEIMTSHSVSDSQKLACPHSNAYSSSEFLLPNGNVCQSNMTMKACPPSLCSIYPICLVSPHDIAVLPSNDKELIIKEDVVIHDFFLNSDVKTNLEDHTDDRLSPRIDCDLSLQLGSIPASSPRLECSPLKCMKDGGFLSNVKKIKLDDQMPEIDSGSFLSCTFNFEDSSLSNSSSSNKHEDKNK